MKHLPLDVIDNHRSKFRLTPDGWVQRRMRFAVAHYQLRKNTESDPTVLSLTKQGIRVKTDLNFGKSTESYVGHQLVEKGQFVFTPRDFDATPILAGVSEYRGCISNLYIVFDISPKIYPKFLEYFFYGLREGYNFFEKLSFGMRYSFNRTQFESIPLLVPPFITQRTIADFLDRETARIDQLIEKKQRLVELLEEKSSYIVRNALKPVLEDVFWNSDKRTIDFKFHDDDWSVACVKNVSSFMTSGSRGWSEFLNDDGEIFLQSGNIGRNLEVNFSDASRVYPQVGAEAVRTSVQKSDTLVCITGGRTGAVGFISNLPERSYINQHICLIRPESQKIEPKLLAMLLWSEIGQVQFDLFQYGLKQGLSFSEVGNTKIPLPPRAKHECILRRITESHQKATELFEMIRESITRLREFRSALITAAVTGQIDVDEWSRRGGTYAKLDAIAQEMEARA